jgi:UDP-N-acetyl-D-mannosaminuronic acid dehydrogenase
MQVAEIDNEIKNIRTISSNPFSKISILGLGYIGLPTAALFASQKISILGIDINKTTVETINRGQIHIVEPELEKFVQTAVENGYLRASLIPEPADAFLIAVPTPFKDNYEPDLSCIQSACLLIAPVLKKGDLIILESTSPVGTTEQLAIWLSELRPDLSFPGSNSSYSDVHIAYCPERVLPGQILKELIQNDRVIGGLTPKCSALAASLYENFIEGECIITNARTAEMCKLTENSYRDVNIAFANELSMICDTLDISVWDLIKLANRHPRVSILQPGAGVGGHCIAVDPWFIVHKTPEQAKLIKMARTVNNNKPLWVLEKIQEAIDQYLKNYPYKKIEDLTLACLGLSFKPNIDDLRESPALEIVKAIAQTYTCKIMVVEPHIDILPESIKEKVTLCSMERVLQEANIVIKLVNHTAFVGFSKIKDGGILLEVTN